MVNVGRTVAEALPRTIDVTPPRHRAETVNVLRAMFLVAFWSVVVLHVQAVSHRGAAGEAEAADPPFVARFGSLEAGAQRTYRAFQEGIVEAERARARRGAWPTAAELADELIPPFAADPLDQAGYVWRSAIEGTTVNYVGTPNDTAAPTFVAILVEPDRGAPKDPNAKVDEVHHDVDGVIVHVSTFVGTGEAPRDAVPALNLNEGWKQILVGPASVIGR